MFTPAFARDGECATPGAFLRTPAMAPLTTPTPRRAFDPQPRVFRRADVDADAVVSRLATATPSDPHAQWHTPAPARPAPPPSDGKIVHQRIPRHDGRAPRAKHGARLPAQHTLAPVDEDAESLGAARRTLFDPLVARRLADRDDDSDDDRDDDTPRLPARPSPRKRLASRPAPSPVDDDSPDVSLDDLREEDVSPDTVLDVSRRAARAASKMDVDAPSRPDPNLAPRSPFKAARSSLAQSSPGKRDDVARRRVVVLAPPSAQATPRTSSRPVERMDTNRHVDARACLSGVVEAPSAPGARAGAAGKPTSRTASRVLRLLTRGGEASRATGVPIRLPASRLEDRFAALELAREGCGVGAVVGETAARGPGAQPRW